MTIIKELPLSKEGFLYMSMLAKRCGIDLTDYKKSAMINRLLKRLHQLHIPDFDTYCKRLREDLEEEVIFINLITNSTTSFFREEHHFDYLRDKLIPDLISKKNKIRIWSAGCSTGQEAYSIAMVLCEKIPNIAQFDIKILATDINSDVLTTAEFGIYHHDAIKKLSIQRQKRWFKLLLNHDKCVEVSEQLKSLVTFNHLNLMDPWPMRGLFDIIFCRNVLIYFKQNIGQNIVTRFHQILEPNGTLFLGHSETLYDLRKNYQNVGKTIYQKISDKGR